MSKTTFKQVSTFNFAGHFLWLRVTVDDDEKCGNSGYPTTLTIQTNSTNDICIMDDGVTYGFQGELEFAEFRQAIADLHHALTRGFGKVDQ